MMDISLKDKVALVSGSTQGIGKATAEGLASMGAKVILLARNEDKLKSALSDLKAIADTGHDYIVADFSNPDEVKNAVENMLVKHPQIHILVNNTGGPPAGKAIDADVDEFKKAFDMHLICNHIITGLLVDGMTKSGNTTRRSAFAYASPAPNAYETRAAQFHVCSVERSAGSYRHLLMM